MAYSISTKGLRCFRTYQQALQHYESIKPIKSKKYHRDGLRPIGDRRQLNKTIHQLSNGDIACQLYSTDCVVYHQDDSITVDFGGYHTNSTSAFIHTISPFSAHSNGYIHTSKGIFKVPSHGLKILPDGTPVNPVQEYRTLLDKKKAAETRKKLKPFIQWGDACVRLKGEWFGRQWNRSEGVYAVERVLQGDEDWYEPAAMFCFFGPAGKEALFGEAYTIDQALIQIPVPLGTERRPTQWD